MIELFIHILLSTAFGLIVKHAQVRGRNLWVVGAVNYITAALTASISTLAQLPIAPNHFSQPTLIVGVLAGVGYVVSYFFLITVVKRDGISVPMAVVRLSILIPILFSIFYWQEKPNVYQIIGIGLVCLSLPLLTRNRSLVEKKKQLSLQKGGFDRTQLILLILFFLTGWCSLSSKVFVQVSPQDSRELFLMFLFVTAAIIGLVPLVIFRTVPTIGEIFPGIVLGLCNIYQNHFLLVALNRLPGMVVFPIANSSALVLTALFAWIVWHERLRRVVIVGILISVVALVFINL
ncbi:MAG: EamA family transporter [Candidatus Poribacteria bacterium]|nr:EamA family transporter [Candidatus Poribacteria bacterium]